MADPHEPGSYLKATLESQPAELKRLLDRIQISTGMLKIRVSVMEFGRFTKTDCCGAPPSRAAKLIIVHCSL